MLVTIASVLSWRPTKAYARAMHAKRLMRRFAKVAYVIRPILVGASVVGCGGLIYEPPTSSDDDGGFGQSSSSGGSEGGAPRHEGGAGDGDSGLPYDSGVSDDDAGDADHDATLPPCGDGVLTADEACDDGNLSGADGCSASCEIEPGWACAGSADSADSPRACEPICGDGILVGGETCDDSIACPGICRGTLWSKRYGDSSTQQTVGLAVDTTGAAIITGFYQGTLDFGGGPLPSTGASDLFVAKLDGSGKHLWSHRFGGKGDDRALAIAVDSAGNVVVTGVFSDTIDFGGGRLVANGSWDVFVVKFDAAGHHLWSKRFGDSDQQEGHALAIDANGNIIVAGSFWGVLDFGGGALTNAGNETDIFVAKLDADGNHVWSKRFGDSGRQEAQSVAVNAAGDVFVTGDCGGTVDFGGGPLAAIGERDAYLSAFDATGQHRWSKRWGTGNAYDGGSSVTVDPAGNVLLAGYSQGRIDLGTGMLMGKGNLDILLGKFTPAGTPIFARLFGTVENEFPTSVATDQAGNILLTGYNEGPTDFGNGPLAHTGLRNTFIAKFDASGAPVWSKDYGTSATGVGIATNGPNVLLTGYFTNTIDFGTGAFTNAGGYYGGDDIFVAKLTP